MNKLNALRNRKAKLLADGTALTQRGLNSAGSRAEYKKITDELDEVQFDIDSLERIDRTLLTAPAPIVPSEDVERTSRRHKKHLVNRAWKHYFRNGSVPQSVEQRDVITTSDADGAALIPQEYDKAWTDALKFYGPIASLVSVSDQASGRPLKRAVSDDTGSTMSYLAETGATSSLEEDPTLSSQITGVSTLLTKITYSYEMFQDSVSPIEDFINQLSGIRVARAIEYAITLGKDNGTNTQLPHSPAGGFLGGLTAGVTMPGASLGTVPSYAQLAALKSSVNMAYQIGDKSGFMVSPVTYNALEAQVDSTGRPLYKHDPNTGLLLVANRLVYSNAAMPDYTTASLPAFSGTVTTVGTAVTWVSGSVFTAQLIGQQITINSVQYTVASVTDDHDLVLTTSAGTQSSAVAYTVTAIPAQSVLFGDFSRAAWFVNSGISVKILTERAADVLERIALVTTRIGAAPLVSTAVKSLVNAATS